MNYKGDIIEECLVDAKSLTLAHIVSTRVEPVTIGHKTPWLKQWTLHTIEVTEAEAPALAEKLSHVIENEHGGNWYIDFKNDETHYIIFPEKVFKVDRLWPMQYKPVVAHGLSLNIPSYQLDFSPQVSNWERPEGA